MSGFFESARFYGIDIYGMIKGMRFRDAEKRGLDRLGGEYAYVLDWRYNNFLCL